LAGIGGHAQGTSSQFVNGLTASFRSKFTADRFVSFGVSINNKDLGVLRNRMQDAELKR